MGKYRGTPCLKDKKIITNKGYMEQHDEEMEIKSNNVDTVQKKCI